MIRTFWRPFWRCSSSPDPCSRSGSAAGTWRVEFVTPLGQTGVNMTINQSGTRLTARSPTNTANTPSRGRLADDVVTVVWSVPEDGKMLEITMKGKLEGNVITGTAKLGNVVRARSPLAAPAMRATKTFSGAAVMTRFAIHAAGAVVLAAGPAFAQATIAGDWILSVTSPQGTNSTKVTFTQDGGEVSGLFKGPAASCRSPALSSAAICRSSSRFRSGHAARHHADCKLEGETLSGKADFGGFAEGDWKGKRDTAESTPTTPAPSTTTESTRPPPRRAQSSRPANGTWWSRLQAATSLRARR